MRTHVYPKVQIEPFLVCLGNTNTNRVPDEREETATVYLRADDRSRVPVLVSTAANSPLEVLARYIGPTKEAEHIWMAQVNLRILLRNARTPGSDYITVKYSLNGEEKAAYLPVTWEREQSFVLSPVRLFFRAPQNATPTPQNLRIARRDRTPFVIRRVTCTPGDFDVSADLGSNRAVHNLTVSVSPSASRRVIWGQLRIETDATPDPAITVPVALLRGVYSREIIDGPSAKE